MPPKGSGKQRLPEHSTMLLVFKGAVVQVLGAACAVTVGVEAHKRNEARLTIEYDLPEAPTDAQVAEIVEMTNAKIAEDVKVESRTLARAEAEALPLVNGIGVFDKIPPPESVKEVTVVSLADWNQNASAHEHLASTGATSPIRVKNVNFRPQKSQLCFVIAPGADGAGAAAPGGGKGKGKGKGKGGGAAAGGGGGGAAAAAALPADDLAAARQRIVAAVAAALAANSAGASAAAAAAAPDAEALDALCGADIGIVLTGMKNAAYASGMAAGRSAPRS